MTLLAPKGSNLGAKSCEYFMNGQVARIITGINDIQLGHPAVSYQEVENIVRRALNIGEKALGPQHPDTRVDF